MRIIYITTSLDKDDFNAFNQSWKSPLNTSNQVFHHKMIRAVSSFHKVEVISLRPYNKKLCSLKKLKYEKKEKDKITYHYLAINKNRLLQMSSIKKQINRLMNDEKAIVIVDTINLRCLLTARYMQKKYHYPIIGVCTDSPKNITGINEQYISSILNNAQQLDGYITLTEDLNKLFNIHDKKHINIEGVIEDELPIQGDVEGRYFFFGGALLPRYGVYELIKAFKMIKDEDVSLLIAGHHGDEERLNEEIKDDKRIKYLHAIPVDEVLKFEQHSIANINPRPFSIELDKLSIPSKTLEYLASDSLTISMKNTELEKNFKEAIIWSKQDDAVGLYEAMNTALTMKEKDRKNMINMAKNTAKARYSIKIVGKKINDFLSDFLL